jgi:hypothetical protein
MTRAPISLFTLLLGIGGMGLFSTRADARKPEDVFGGRILVSSQPFPTSARSADAYIDAIKRNVKDRIAEDKETKEWRVFFAAFFKAAPSDVEVSVKVYDVTNGAHRLVDTFEQYLSSSQNRAYVSNVKLHRGDGTSGYDPNTKIQLVMDSHGRVIAETTFYIVGEVKKGPTQVDFSQDTK